jgi:hypothetical protein
VQLVAELGKTTTQSLRLTSVVPEIVSVTGFSSVGSADTVMLEVAAFAGETPTHPQTDAAIPQHTAKVRRYGAHLEPLLIASPAATVACLPALR